MSTRTQGNCSLSFMNFMFMNVRNTESKMHKFHNSCIYAYKHESKKIHNMDLLLPNIHWNMENLE